MLELNLMAKKARCQDFNVTRQPALMLHRINQNYKMKMFISHFILKIDLGSV